MLFWNEVDCNRAVERDHLLFSNNNLDDRVTLS